MTLLSNNTDLDQESSVPTPSPSDLAETTADRASVIIAAVTHWRQDNPGATLADTYHHVADLYCAALTASDDLPTVEEAQRELLATLRSALAAHNLFVKKSDHDNWWPMPLSLSPYLIARLMLTLYRVVLLAPGDSATNQDYDMLVVYAESGVNRGLYVQSDQYLGFLIRQFDVRMEIKGVKEVIAILRERARRVTATDHVDLVPVNNGIFNYSTDSVTVPVTDANGTMIHEITFPPKALSPFDPDVIFTAKSRVNYVDDPALPVLHDHPEDGSAGWDVVSWVNDLSDDPGVPELLWEVMGAVIRPYVRFNKAVMFYSEQGNNGKGTLCSLMRNLCGPGAHTSIALTELGGEFALEPLMNVTAIINDENETGALIDQAANLKKIVTHDVLRVNRKNKPIIAFRFHGLMVQCLNKLPATKDKSASIQRRLLFVPFNKCFTGQEHKWIKDEYLGRPDVLEYVLWYVLNQAGSVTPGLYYEFVEPPVTAAIMRDYTTANDSVAGFWDEFSERFAWDLLPFTFLYDLYKSWFGRNIPSGHPVAHRSFVDQLRVAVDGDAVWSDPGKDTSGKGRTVRTGSKMDASEPLIIEYDLDAWKNPAYSGANVNRIASPLRVGQYRGLVRRATSLTGISPVNEEETETQNGEIKCPDLTTC